MVLVPKISESVATGRRDIYVHIYIYIYIYMCIYRRVLGRMPREDEISFDDTGQRQLMGYCES